MAVTQADLLALNYAYNGLPFAAIEASSSENTLALGFSFYGLPFVGLGGASGPVAATTGLRIKKGSSIIELLLVAEGSGATAMGGVPKINKNGTNYALYLVETTDPNASPVRIKTSTGIKAVRLPG